MSIFSDEEKVEIIMSYQKGASIHELGKQFDIYRSSIRQWIGLYENHGISNCNCEFII